MAWINANLPPINSAIVTNDDVFINGAVDNNHIKTGIDWTVQINQTFWETYANSFVIGDENNGIYVAGDQSLKFYHNGSQYYRDISLNWDWGPGAPYYGIFWAGYDDENQIGSIGYIRRYYNFPESDYPFEYLSAPAIRNDTIIYQVLKNCNISPYTWSSVPTISGKNGSLSLPTLVDTDGNPISGQSASVFSSLPEGSNVKALINGAL